MADSRSAPPPKGLHPRARRLWKEVVSAYKLRPDELILLETACKTVGLVADLEAALVGAPLVTKGSMGQQRENPILSELRQQRVALNRTLAQLDLPDVDPAGEGRSGKGVAAVNQQRAAAHSRWRYGR